MDEQQAVFRLKHGDMAGLEVLVHRYQERALRAAYLITADPALAQDVVQESFIRAYRAIRTFDSRRPFEPWFLRSVVNAAIRAARKDARQMPLDDEAGGQAFALVCAQIESVEAQVEAAETQERIWAAMRCLSARQRAVIVQRYFLDMSEKEMSAELQAPPGTIKWLLNAARARLRTLLAERSEE